jgi:hypothetical protein
MLLSMAFELHFATFAHQALAAFLAAAAEDGATSFGSHAGTEAVLLFASALGWTIGRAHGRMWLRKIKQKMRGDQRSGRGF